MFRPTYEQVGQKETREVVDLHQQRQSIAALFIPRPQHPGIVHQNIQTIFRLVDLFGESSHRLERRHIHQLHHRIFVPRFSNYLLLRVVGLAFGRDTPKSLWRLSWRSRGPSRILFLKTQTCTNERLRFWVYLCWLR
jgi:hypothetical protein